MHHDVPIILDRPRTLRFDANAIADFEVEHECSIADVIFAKRIGFGSIRGLFWAGAKHEDRRLTLERAAQILEDFIASGGKLQEVTDKVLDAAQNSRLIQALLGGGLPNSTSEASSGSPAASGNGSISNS